MSKLSNSIQDIYKKNISEQEAIFVSENLVRLFTILEKIDSRLSNKQTHENTYANNRSTN